MQTYQQAAAYLGAKTDRPRPGRATRIVRRTADTIAIRYQSTDVVTYHADGTITLRSGGWYTPTTKARIVDYTRARVWQTHGTWFVGTGSSSAAALFVDGMTIAADGTPIDPTFPTATDRSKKRAFDKLIREYIAAFGAHVTAGKLEPPSAGDCWGCLFKVQNADINTPIGAWRRSRPTPHGRQEPLGVSHYFDHAREGYFVPSLLANAIVTRGFAHPGVIWEMIAGRNDGKWAAQILRSYFKDLKPALFAAWDNGGEA